MRDYPDKTPEAYRADPALAEAYEDGWLVAARLEQRAKEKLDWEAWAGGCEPDKPWHRDIWWGLVREEQRRHWRFSDREVEDAFDAGALDAIEAGLAEFTDADYEMHGGEDAATRD
jgi:hypothetical protein